jgi:hypothetical protein
MIFLSSKFKAFGAAVVGLAAVVAAQYISDPTLLTAIEGVLSTLVVYTVANRPS